MCQNNVNVGCRYYPSVVEKIHSTSWYYCDPVDYRLLPQSQTAPGHSPDHPAGGHQGTQGTGPSTQWGSTSGHIGVHYRGQHHVI